MLADASGIHDGIVQVFPRLVLIIDLAHEVVQVKVAHH
jgi:hypothetical protein